MPRFPAYAVRAHGLALWPSKARLLRFVELEYAACLFEVEDVSIDDELVFACVIRYVVNAFHFVAASAKLLD